MRPINSCRVLLLGAALLLFGGRSAAERLEFVDYYPAVIQIESGEGGRLHADRATVGDPDYSPANVVDGVDIFDGELFIRRGLGVGTTQPQALLHVEGGVHFAGGSGDVNNDGQLTSADAAAIGDYLNAGLAGALLPADRRARADVNGDGWVDTLDRQLIARAAGAGSVPVAWTVFPDAPLGKSVADRLLHITFDQVTGAGRVGVGTPDPNAALEITGNFQLPRTTVTNGLSSGVIYLEDQPFLHSSGEGVYLGIGAGTPQRVTSLREGFNSQVAVGFGTLSNTPMDAAHVAVGSGALGAGHRGENVGIGFEAGRDAGAGGGQRGDRLVAIGRRAAAAVSQERPVAIGAGAMELHNVRQLDYSVAVGREALRGGEGAFRRSATGTTPTHQVAVGWRALRETGDALNNVAIGSRALEQNAYGFRNTAVGAGALASNSGGWNRASAGFNVAIGSRAMLMNVEGHQNTAVGAGALQRGAAGGRNIAIGAGALAWDREGWGNIAVGGLAILQNPPSAWTGNTVLGVQAMDSLLEGGRNVAVGWRAGFDPDVDDRVASDNLFIGPAAGWNETGSKILAIGNQADFPLPLIRGDLNSPAALLQINGDVGVLTAAAPAYPLDVAGDVVAMGKEELASDLRLKADIRPLTGVLGKLERLQGISYAWGERFRELSVSGSVPPGRRIGLIAQEVERVFPEMVGRGGGGHLSVSYSQLGGVFAEAVRALDRENAEIRERISRLERLLPEGGA